MEHAPTPMSAIDSIVVGSPNLRHAFCFSASIHFIIICNVLQGNVKNEFPSASNTGTSRLSLSYSAFDLHLALVTPLTPQLRMKWHRNPHSDRGAREAFIPS